MPGSEVNTESLELSDEGASIPSSKRQKTENTTTQIESNSELTVKEKTDDAHQQSETDVPTPHSNQNFQGDSKEKELSAVSIFNEETGPYKENCITVPENTSEIENELKLFYQELEKIESETDLLANGYVDGSQDSAESKEDAMNKYGLNTTVKACKRIADVQHMSGKIENPHTQILTTECPYTVHWNHNLGTPIRSQWNQLQTFIGPQGPPLPRFNIPLADQRYNVLSRESTSFPYDQKLLSNSYVDDSNFIAFSRKNDSILQTRPINNCMIRSRYFHNYGPHENTTHHQQIMLKPNLCQQYRQAEQLTNPAVGDKLLIFMRGPPGCGKSTLSRLLLDQCPNGVVLSTDDYFCQNGGYCFDPNFLGEAHEWNQNRAKRCMDEGRSPIIIDNTNIQAWEMKPYAEMAVKRRYRMSFREPETWWKFNVVELEKRNRHRVPREKIIQMMARFEHPMSSDIVLNSVEPSYSNKVMLNLFPHSNQRWEGPLGSSSISGVTNR
ncbi:NEDD4-binding protein 2-like 2 isoform X2 [Pristis pectinata]|nr:NEDD4-binding protein 2-like 2 isoform X2 [Pristis pectinata]XP_051881462.1 NEDD4-binding protein 2-like 2 isoform X2 [Pristis pectinata]XP_051881463.1 NEDD4-binding protein 2-like 2 isoform X2 [Pristis pectinata]XP_051881465.1 NEDD4-binding protein 2-like 2 isoform X2 [Pristis pectinata]XP_051881466.1 NEDD4-binding protein 2-like 2 isoform X2 [Pristis pectinata]XP_051881467.1 NEDD4-binding protein 2-like 2 isoform X2 [Pristis pectinata]XP_051881468.1 NEDD4-binding protein 2-like 2 isoform